MTIEQLLTKIREFATNNYCSCEERIHDPENLMEKLLKECDKWEEELKLLAAEAKKYKSAEEFVAKQLKVGDEVEFRSSTMRSTIIKGKFVKRVGDKFLIKTELAGFKGWEYNVPLRDLQLTEFYNQVKNFK